MHLSARTCQLGVIHNRTEKHGEEDVPAIDVPITGFALTAEEFNGLLVNPFAHRALFDTSKNPAEPVLTGIKPLGLKEKFHEAHVTLRAASARSSEVILQLAKRLDLYEPESTVTRAAEAHRRYLRSLTGAVG